MLLRALIVALAMSLAMGESLSPVLIWGVNSPAKSSLQTVTEDDFADLLAPLLKSHMMVVFLEEQLSSRDFLCHKADESASCYAHLSGFAPKTYYASVENPAEALRTLTKARDYNIVDSTGKLQAPLECTPGKVTFVSFDDVTSNGRADTLEAHDVAMADIANGLGECRVVYLYMSTPSSAKSRARRDTAAQTGGYVFRQNNQFLIFWSDLFYNDGSGSGYQSVVMNSMAIQNDSATSFGVTLTSASSKQLKFNITLGVDGYYTMTQIQYDGQSFYSTLLNAPTSFSYHCGNLTLNTIPPATSSAPIAYLKWNALQFQAPFNAKTTNNFAFGDSWDCVPFFTPGILSGLFVVTILLAIMFVGVCWMIDINTMDRFDDPKGKTITINASD